MHTALLTRLQPPNAFAALPPFGKRGAAHAARARETQEQRGLVKVSHVGRSAVNPSTLPCGVTEGDGTVAVE